MWSLKSREKELNNQVSKKYLCINTETNEKKRGRSIFSGGFKTDLRQGLDLLVYIMPNSVCLSM